jgi:3-isopropylmalate dehydrogenase
MHLAYKYAGQRRKKVTMVDKANVIATSRLWRQITQEIAPSIPILKPNTCLWIMQLLRIIQWPKSFDVLVTENLFGDILTDEASVITGSLGMLPSASVGISYFGF